MQQEDINFVRIFLKLWEKPDVHTGYVLLSGTNAKAQKTII